MNPQEEENVSAQLSTMELQEQEQPYGNYY